MLFEGVQVARLHHAGDLNPQRREALRAGADQPFGGLQGVLGIEGLQVLLELLPAGDDAITQFRVGPVPGVEDVDALALGVPLRCGEQGPLSGPAHQHLVLHLHPVVQRQAVAHAAGGKALAQVRVQELVLPGHGLVHGEAVETGAEVALCGHTGIQILVEEGFGLRPGQSLGTVPFGEQAAQFKRGFL